MKQLKSLHFLFFGILVFIFERISKTKKKLLGTGKKRNLSQDESHNLRQYLRKEEIINEGDEIPGSGIFFQRAFFKTEIHSKSYSRIRGRCSTNVAVIYEINGRRKEYFGTVHNFLLFKINDRLLRLAFVSIFYPLKETEHGVQRVNRNREYQTGKFIPINSIDRKIILLDKGGETRILEIPDHRSKIAM